LQGQQISPDQYDALHYRHIGPVGNRISSVVGAPGDRFTYYAGAATGGIWRTTDGGINWEPVFDDQPVHAVGTLAVAASDPQIVWAGTGEPHIRSNVSIGNGVWKSTDGGDTWQHMGLEGADPDHPRRPPHDGRRRDVGADPVRGREHRRVGSGDGSAQPPHPDRWHVGVRPADLGA
jgi:photosystem II stability/assembly factor-like uncharacterized protein